MSSMNEVKLLAVNGQLGYGFPESSFLEGMSRKPDLVGVDGGSTDGGPYYLASGKSLTGKKGVKRDLSLILPAVLKEKIPFVIGTASTAGGEPHVKTTLDILKELAAEKGYRFRVAIIHSEVDKNYVKQKLRQGKVKPLGSHVPQLTEEEIDKSIRIVGQMGVTPFIRALDYNTEVILAGRSCDTAIFAALPIKKGLDPGLSFHAAKIMECGAYAAEPGSASDSIWAVIRQKDFILDSLNPKRRCTPVSVAAHTMYEQGDPTKFYEPDGLVDYTDAQFEQYNETAVRVWGAKHIPAKGKWTIKLEGAALEGYRTISIVGSRDPILIKNVDTLMAKVTEEVEANLGPQEDEGYAINYRVYGKNAILRDLETEPCMSHEIGIVIDVVARNQELANSVCAIVRSSILHYHYPDRKTTGGNVAIPFSPADIPVGPVYRFNVYHTVEVDDPNDLFPIEIVEVGK